MLHLAVEPFCKAVQWRRPPAPPQRLGFKPTPFAAIASICGHSNSHECSPDGEPAALAHLLPSGSSPRCRASPCRASPCHGERAGRISKCSAGRAARNALARQHPRNTAPPAAAAAARAGRCRRWWQHLSRPEVRVRGRHPREEGALQGEASGGGQHNGESRQGKSPSDKVPRRLRSHRVVLLWVLCVLQAEQNKLVMAGALTDPVDGAIFIFR